MSQSDVRIALGQKLFELDPFFETSPSNVKFEPKQGTPYQAYKFIPQSVENPTFGDNFHRENGIFEVKLCYPLYAGEGEIMQKADEIKVHFRRGLSVQNNNTKTTIRSTPTIGTAFIDGDRYCIICSIFYYSNQI